MTWALVGLLSLLLPLNLLQSNSNFQSRTFLPEPQVRSIANHVRPDRQSESYLPMLSLFWPFIKLTFLSICGAALLFSATFRKKVERLARDILSDPIRVVQGDVGEVCLQTVQLEISAFHYLGIKSFTLCNLE